MVGILVGGGLLAAFAAWMFYVAPECVCGQPDCGGGCFGGEFDDD